VIWYRRFNGSFWSTPDIISPCLSCCEPAAWYFSPDIAIGPDDLVHVVWNRGDSPLLFYQDGTSNYIEYSACQWPD